ncbi:MAG: discoidin domain-containing protein [Planctomycetes bacterium]|nr:discoidin domain-containing protein [Planctomycetota bacterium]
MRHRALCILWLLAAGETPAAAEPSPSSEADAFRRQVEADWLLREELRSRLPLAQGPVTTTADAAGGCDGIRDGGYGFHTDHDERPWWQVDLGEEREIGRIVIWNRCDGATERASRLVLSLSADGRTWTEVYRHGGEVFLGAPDGRPLAIPLDGLRARFVRVHLPETGYLHLDEVEVFGPGESAVNLALFRPAEQSSASQWSRAHRASGPPAIDWPARTREILGGCRSALAELRSAGVDAGALEARLRALEARSSAAVDAPIGRDEYIEARWILREARLAHPLLDFDAILFAKRVPGSFNHMSDQYIGWWSRPGGGLYILRGLKSGAPRIECISGAFSEPGSFLRPDLSWDGKRVLFAWCRHYPHLAQEQNKLDKSNVPEDAFYHLFEMDIDGTGLRRLTRGKYDDFDGRYLPDGRIVFLSTRRGQFIQCGAESARETLLRRDLPDIYVRCGGGPERPCVVYTLHTMDADGSGLVAISPFEMFEWTPSVASDGTILYSRWDYVDRDNMPYMGLWSIRPDGSNSRIVYANFTRSPHCTFEPRAIPGSSRIVFTASGHHQQTKGSLVLLDPAVGDEGEAPIRRLTPEVPFPEAEGWPLTYYANPWPLSEQLYLVAWGPEGVLSPPRELGWARWHSVERPAAGMGIYLFDAGGEMELIHRDPEISSFYPIPLRPRTVPPRIAPADPAEADAPPEGRFLLVDVYRGLGGVERGAVKSLRIVAIPPKTHPTMNLPAMGITRDDPGKCVLGTVPVEPDGSAYFRVPAGVIVFFQALDLEGVAVQTMRSATHVQPGQTLSCIGCHEGRQEAPPLRAPHAASREPSRITPGPEGSWPLRFDRLVQPVLEKRCVSCHRPGAEDAAAAAFDLSAGRSYEALVGYGRPSLKDHVLARYREGRSAAGDGESRRTPLLALLADPKGHQGVRLDAGEIERFIVWMDTYAQRLGSFSDDQEQRLIDLKQRCRHLLTSRP